MARGNSGSAGGAGGEVIGSNLALAAYLVALRLSCPFCA